MDKVDYYYNNSHLLVIQGMHKNTISVILKRAKYFKSIKDNKILPFKLAKAGSLGMETLLSSKVSLVKLFKISLKSASKLLSYGPSKVLGLNTGRISKGSPADFTIIDIEKNWPVKGNNMLSLL